MTTCYHITVYHDEPDEAAADTDGRGYYPTRAEAIAAARAAFDGYWHSATIDIGTFYPGRPGIEPDHFEPSQTAPVAYVGPDWID